MSKVFIDEALLKQMHLSASLLPSLNVLTTTRVHCRIHCSLNEILASHTTHTETDYVTNAIHFKGAPLVYTCNNTMDGLFGKRAYLTYVPSSPMLKMLAGTGVAMGAMSAVSSMLRVFANANTASSHRRHHRPSSNTMKPLSTMRAMAAVGVGVGAGASLVAYPFARYLSKYTDYVPFSNYSEVSDQYGKWTIAQQYDSVTQRVYTIIIVPLPSGKTTSTTLSKTLIDCCALRIISKQTSWSQRIHKIDYVADKIDSGVIRGTLYDIHDQVSGWERCFNDWKSMWVHTNITYTEIAKYNKTHLTEVYANVVSFKLQNIALPIQTFRPDERAALNNSDTFSFCKIQSVATDLPQVVKENILYYWRPVHTLCESQYIHRAQLLPRSVHHLFVLPLKQSKIQSLHEDAKVFIEQMKETSRTTTHRRVLDQLEVRDGFIKYILVYVSSNRINSHIGCTAQMYHPYACDMYTCVLPAGVALTAFCQELVHTQLGGERFAFRSQSAFVKQHQLKLYSSVHSNAIVTTVYEKVKHTIDTELKKHTHAKEYGKALHTVLDAHYTTRIKHTRDVLKKRLHSDLENRFRTKKELRRIRLHYMKKREENRSKKMSVKELERQLTKLTLEKTKKRTVQNPTRTRMRNQIVIL